MTETDYTIGQTVAVPWGLDVIEGVVVGTYGEGLARRILVDVAVAGEDEPPATLPFPVHVLDAAKDSAQEKVAGSWLSAYQYELALYTALEKVISALDPTGFTEQGGSQGDQEYDIAVVTSGKKLFVEAKHYSRTDASIRSEAVLQLQAALSRARDRSREKMAGLLVTSATIPPNLLEYANSITRQGFAILIVRWHPEDGFKSLIQPVRTALAGAL
ncbi:restriction endonuclease [Actinacidiphila guanduensis]|uniref:restriction endonuclease n=1 Tax=Actinacidiphila guanduensis TaxID=310781 RepID=UPI00115F80E2|nr:restriction endonuclease [Actinacidiphila guanduensis]